MELNYGFISCLEANKNSPGSTLVTNAPPSNRSELSSNGVPQNESRSELPSASAAELATANSGWSGLSLPESRLFGTDGIRGRVGDLLTAPLALQLGFWAGQVLRSNAMNSGPIVIGQDSRNSSGMLAMALSAGLTAAGIDVWDLGLCPTPGVAHLTHQSEAIGGVMISASHNPRRTMALSFWFRWQQAFPSVAGAN